jgi:vancomycin resistance protein YoaR
MQAIRQVASTDIALATESIAPGVTAEDLDAARGDIMVLVGEDVAVRYGDSTWTIERNALAGALRLPEDLTRDKPRLDPALLVPALEPIADEVNHPPQDATVAWDGGLYATGESYDGVEVDRDALAEKVAKAAATNDRSVELPLTYVPPAVDASNLGALWITDLLASGASSFEGSSEARATNVAVAAEHISGALIPPGGIFSFNDALGPITTDDGYVEGKIIKGDWYASDLGGGVCQVSTTVYRAALLAGLPFVEWHPHSFRLGFYELDGWPVGMDAAIYQPNTPDEWEMDLQFENTTDTWMLLQMRVDETTVTAELYGSPTGYKVEIADPVLGESIPPPKPEERESDKLPAGERELIQTAQPGVEVTLTRRVTKDGDVISEDTFVSPYQAQGEITLVGTGD